MTRQRGGKWDDHAGAYVPHDDGVVRCVQCQDAPSIPHKRLCNDCLNEIACRVRNSHERVPGGRTVGPDELVIKQADWAEMVLAKQKAEAALEDARRAARLLLAVCHDQGIGGGRVTQAQAMLDSALAAREEVGRGV